MNIMIFAILTALLMGCHYLSPYLREIPGLNYQRIRSLAAGVAMSYVFLHMLPNLIESRNAIHALLEQTTTMSPFKDLIVFALALLGFEVFYILERICIQKDTKEKELTYRLDLSKYFIYNALITYTMLVRIETGINYAIVFTMAMGFHFVLTDNYFAHHYSHLFKKKSHLFLLLGLLVGFLLATLFPVNVLASAFLTAFLAGAILYNSFAQELSLRNTSSMGFFFLGTVIMGLLLAVFLIG